MNLKIADGLSLPMDVVTQTLAVLAKRRAGKSYAMRRLVEQLFKAGQQIVLVDPKGDQWGIRSSADGKAPGLPMMILGGERGDIPLEASSGEIVAKLVVEERISVLLDLSPFRKHEVSTFMTAFLENLYRLKAREIYRTPMMLVIDEADAIAPQKPQKGEERMLGAAEDIVRRGGQRGIGCVLVTQRSAVLNKNVLTQAQILIVLRTIAPQDLAAMDAWIDVHGEPHQRKTLMESLPSLPIGDAWFWSPGWPTIDGIFKRVHVLPIDTFDSGASPKPGVKPIEPKRLADIDLDAVKGQMAATIEKAKAEDPKLLRAEIARLRREAAEMQPVEIQRAALASEYNRGFREGEMDGVKTVAERLRPLIHAAQEMIGRLDNELARDTTLPPGWLMGFNQATAPAGWTIRAKGNIPPSAQASRPAAQQPIAVAASGLPKAERLILTALAQYPQGRSKVQVALLTGYAKNGGSFNNSLGALRSKGWIEGRGENLTITQSGKEALGEHQPLPVGSDLLEHWCGRLGKAERSILQALAFAYPAAISKAEVGNRTGYEPNGGSFNNALGRLRTLELIVGRGELRASDNLF